MTFWILAPIMVAAALGLLFVRKAVHAAMMLAVVMISLAILYAVLDAPFLFAVQIIVYTGAILMLFLFVLMLVGVDASDSVVETIKGQRALATLGRAAARRRARGRAEPGHARQRGRPGRGQRGRQHPGPRQHPVLALRLRVRDHQRAADHRRHRRDGARAPRAAHAQGDPGGAAPPAGCRTTRETGKHPGPLPSPGVYARHNAVDTPALLPDGTASESSVSRVLAARGVVRSAPALADDIEGVQEQLGGVSTSPDGGARRSGQFRRHRLDRGGRGMTQYVVLSAILFTIGCVGVLTRRNAIVVFMCVELMLNASNLALVAFAKQHGNLDGQIAAFFVMVVAAAEVVVGLAIIMTIFRTRRSASVDDASLLKY